MASDYSYQFTEKAAQDLDDILDYIAVTLSNPTAAKLFYEKLFQSINNILLFPNAGTPVNNPSIRLPNVRKLFIKNYTLYYILNSKTKSLIILRIVYSHRDLSEIIQTLGNENGTIRKRN